MNQTEKLEIKSFQQAKDLVNKLNKAIGKDQKAITKKRAEINELAEGLETKASQLAAAAEWLADIVQSMHD